MSRNVAILIMAWEAFWSVPGLLEPIISFRQRERFAATLEFYKSNLCV